MTTNELMLLAMAIIEKHVDNEFLADDVETGEPHPIERQLDNGGDWDDFTLSELKVLARLGVRSLSASDVSEFCKKGKS